MVLSYLNKILLSSCAYGNHKVDDGSELFVDDLELKLGKSPFLKMIWAGIDNLVKNLLSFPVIGPCNLDNPFGLHHE